MEQIKIIAQTDFGHLLDDNDEIAHMIIDRFLFNLRLTSFKYHIENEKIIDKNKLIGKLRSYFSINLICSFEEALFKLIIKRNAVGNDEIILYSMSLAVMIQNNYINVAYYLEKLLDICEHVQILNIKTERVNNESSHY